MSATVPLHELAPGLALARGGPGRTLNVYLLGDVVLDAGVRWSRRRLARQLAGRQLRAHALTHAHFDHAGSSAWLCHAFGLPLWCGAGDAGAITSGRVDSHGAPLVNRLQRRLAPVAPHPVGRTLAEGDVVGGFEVLEVPGHSPGALAFWREGDRVLVCGDVVANFGLHPARPRLVLAPAALSSDYQQNRRSAGRAAPAAGLLRARLRGHRPRPLLRRPGPARRDILVGEDKRRLEQASRDRYRRRGDPLRLEEGQFLAIQEEIKDAMLAVQRRMARLEQGRALAAIPVGMTLRQAWDAADIGWRRTILSLVVVKVLLYPGLPGRRVWPADDSPLLDRAKSLGGPWCFDPSKIDIQWKV